MAFERVDYENTKRDQPRKFGGIVPILADFVVKVGCKGLAIGPFVKSRGFDALALTLVAQLQRYAMHIRNPPLWRSGAGLNAQTGATLM